MGHCVTAMLVCCERQGCGNTVSESDLMAMDVASVMVRRKKRLTEGEIQGQSMRTEEGVSALIVVAVPPEEIHIIQRVMITRSANDWATFPIPFQANYRFWGVQSLP